MHPTSCELNDIKIQADFITWAVITISNIKWQLSSDIFLALPFFYDFTGCDIASSLCGKGKCKAYTVWVKSDRNDDFIDVFVDLRERPIYVK